MTSEMKDILREHICRWAFLTPNQFTDDDSLKALRKDFGIVSKLGMLTACLFPKSINGKNISMNTVSEGEDGVEEEVEALDTVNDFLKYLKSKGHTKINEVLQI